MADAQASGDCGRYDRVGSSPISCIFFCFTEITCLLEFTLWDDYKFIFDSKTNKCYTSR